MVVHLRDLVTQLMQIGQYLYCFQQVEQLRALVTQFCILTACGASSLDGQLAIAEPAEHYQNRENNPGSPAFSTTCAGWPFYWLCGIQPLNNNSDVLRCVRPEEKKCGNACTYAFCWVSSAMILLMADNKIA